MSTRPFVHEFVQSAVPALMAKAHGVMIVTMTQQATLPASVTTLQPRGWVQVIDRAKEPGRPVPMWYEPARPQLVFVQYTGEYEAEVVAHVRSCQQQGSRVVVVGTDFAGLEVFHERYRLCELYIYLLQEKEDMQPLFDEILRTKLS
jgi:hypothetical protein